ncbi:carbohydrate ABC transporter permease [Auraticoccus monumenti]|uniref:Carbohydrate ABC transporter membrane protein 1, CUT1 family n=1 Tax=Auraticoccus monumenti TaxID=675864 RepID=A0A1G6THN4_9ACTN|nr:sugar ABC transporter permease [Auraticoccus monumenti]SDD27937.1 carbohydrate ABC transporter membrane protein 1, CUT1 family [Auraticoccus monumenti]
MSTATAPLPPASTTVQRSQRDRARRGAARWWIYLFLLPTAVLYGAYTLWPVVASWWYSLLSWSGFGAERTFVGLQNYADVLADPLFHSSFRLTMLFMVVTVPLRVLAALLVAVLLNHPRLPLQRLFRTAFFLPVVTTTAIVGVVMQFIFDPASGPVNLALGGLGVAPVDWLGSPETALWTVMVVHTWKWLGVTMIYWLAALQTIPRDLVEAAEVDGANGWQTFRHITLPLMVPFLVIITLLTVEQNLQVFDLVLTMTGGGPFYATEVIELYIYRWAFASSVPQLGFASAAAVVLGLVLLVIGVGQLLGIRAARRLAGGGES